MKGAVTAQRTENHTMSDNSQKSVNEFTVTFKLDKNWYNLQIKDHAFVTTSMYCLRFLKRRK